MKQTKILNPLKMDKIHKFWFLFLILFIFSFQLFIIFSLIDDSSLLFHNNYYQNYRWGSIQGLSNKSILNFTNKSNHVYFQDYTPGFFQPYLQNSRCLKIEESIDSENSNNSLYNSSFSLLSNSNNLHNMKVSSINDIPQVSEEIEDYFGFRFNLPDNKTAFATFPEFNLLILNSSLILNHNYTYRISYTGSLDIIGPKYFNPLNGSSVYNLEDDLSYIWDKSVDGNAIICEFRMDVDNIGSYFVIFYKDQTAPSIKFYFQDSLGAQWHYWPSDDSSVYIFSSAPLLFLNITDIISTEVTIFLTVNNWVIHFTETAYPSSLNRTLNSLPFIRLPNWDHLPDGKIQIPVFLEDEAGNTSPLFIFEFIKDTSPPNLPSIEHINWMYVDNKSFDDVVYYSSSSIPIIGLDKPSIFDFYMTDPEIRGLCLFFDLPLDSDSSESSVSPSNIPFFSFSKFDFSLFSKSDISFSSIDNYYYSQSNFNNQENIPLFPYSSQDSVEDLIDWHNVVQEPWAKIFINGKEIEAGHWQIELSSRLLERFGDQPVQTHLVVSDEAGNFADFEFYLVKNTDANLLGNIPNSTLFQLIMVLLLVNILGVLIAIARIKRRVIYHPFGKPLKGVSPELLNLTVPYVKQEDRKALISLIDSLEKERHEMEERISSYKYFIQRLIAKWRMRFHLQGKLNQLLEDPQYYSLSEKALKIVDLKYLNTILNDIKMSNESQEEFLREMLRLPPDERRAFLETYMLPSLNEENIIKNSNNNKKKNHINFNKKNRRNKSSGMNNITYGQNDSDIFNYNQNNSNNNNYSRNQNNLYKQNQNNDNNIDKLLHKKTESDKRETLDEAGKTVERDKVDETDMVDEMSKTISFQDNNPFNKFHHGLKERKNKRLFTNSKRIVKRRKHKRFKFFLNRFSKKKENKFVEIEDSTVELNENYETNKIFDDYIIENDNDSIIGWLDKDTAEPSSSHNLGDSYNSDEDDDLLGNDISYDDEDEEDLDPDDFKEYL